MSPRDLCMLEVCIVEDNQQYPLAGFRQNFKEEESYMWKEIQLEITSSCTSHEYLYVSFDVTITKFVSHLEYQYFFICEKMNDLCQKNDTKNYLTSQI